MERKNNHHRKRHCLFRDCSRLPPQQRSDRAIYRQPGPWDVRGSSPRTQDTTTFSPSVQVNRRHAKAVRTCRQTQNHTSLAKPLNSTCFRLVILPRACLVMCETQMRPKYSNLHLARSARTDRRRRRRRHRHHHRRCCSIHRHSCPCLGCAKPMPSSRRRWPDLASAASRPSCGQDSVAQCPGREGRLPH